MPTKSPATSGQPPMIDGRRLELFRVTGTVELCTKDVQGNVTTVHNVGQVELYQRHLPTQDDPVFDFEVRAREAQDVHERQRDAIDQRVEALRAQQTGPGTASE